MSPISILFLAYAMKAFLFYSYFIWILEAVFFPTYPYSSIVCTSTKLLSSQSFNSFSANFLSTLDNIYCIFELYASKQNLDCIAEHFFKGLNSYTFC